MSSRSPRATVAELAAGGTQNLARVIAIDSQSDERSDTIPSTAGQRRLSSELADFFASLGLRVDTDANANLIATMPATAQGVPALALMVHMDTSRGTEAVPELEQLKVWDGRPIPYPDNDRLEVTPERYPQTRDYLGEDILFGPGRYPIGLDDKLGMAEMMTVAQALVREPDLPHGEILFVCRPDEEIGRLRVLASLADTLRDRGVRYGYTIDGIGPFEIQVENFYASRGIVRLRGEPLRLAPAAARRLVTLRIEGCKSHGATAKAEGYLNCTVIVPTVLRQLGAAVPVVPVGFVTDVASEVDADVTFLLSGADAAVLDASEEKLVAAFAAFLAPHAYKGARVFVRERRDGSGATFTDEVVQVVRLLHAFYDSEGPRPLLSEQSEDRQGYSNPFSVDQKDGGLRLDFRLRAFDPAERVAREEHLKAVCARSGLRLDVQIERQYENMGPSLKPYPELVRWAQRAGEAAGIATRCCPIRGGTGVDPFLERGIPIANLGTGYFAPESEKELTSRQKIAQHALWLLHLVQEVSSEARV